MGWGIGNDFNQATAAATPNYAAAAEAQGRLDAAEQARIDAIRSGNISGAGSIGKAYLDSPEIQKGVKGFFGGTPTTAPTMGSGMEGMGFTPDASLSSGFGGFAPEAATGFGYTPVPVGSEALMSEVGTNLAADAALGTAAEVGTGLATDAALGTAAELGTGLAADAASSALMTGMPASLTGAAAPVAAGAGGAGGMAAMLTNPVTALSLALAMMLRG